MHTGSRCGHGSGMDLAGASTAVRSRFVARHHQGTRFLDQLSTRTGSHRWCSGFGIDGGQNGTKKVSSSAIRSVLALLGYHPCRDRSKASLHRQIFGRYRRWCGMRPRTDVHLRNLRSLDQRNAGRAISAVSHRWNFCRVYPRKRSQLHHVSPRVRSHRRFLLDYLLLDARISRMVGG